MTAIADNLPYSPAGVEKLAIALGIDSAMIWVSPSTGRIEVKDVPQKMQLHTVQQSPLDEVQE